MNQSLKRQLRRTFFQMLNDLNGTHEIESFWTDFLTDIELEQFIKRAATAYWIKKGRGEENIKQNLCTTGGEIKNVKIILKKEGVKLAIKKLEAEEWANIWVKRIKKFNRK